MRVKKIKETINNDCINDSDRIKIIGAFFTENKIEYNTVQEKMNEIINESKIIVKNADFYNILESKSIKLQNRVSDIVKQVNFDEKTSDK